MHSEDPTRHWAKPIRLAINDFGRIGRRVARLILEGYKTQMADVPYARSLEIVAINDLLTPEQILQALRYDSVHGRGSSEWKLEEGHFLGGTQRIALFREPHPDKLPWSELQVEVVLECTGIFTRHDQARRHLSAGAQRVIISAPAPDPDWSVCVGVNHRDYQPRKHRILSNASCTTNCLAPVLQILTQHFEIKRGDMLTIHSYTNDQVILDGAHSDPRRARSAALSQIPTTTGAAKAIGLILPELAGKISGVAIRVPTPNVSLIYLSAQCTQPASVPAVNDVLRQAAQSSHYSIVEYTQEPCVSTDYNGSYASAVVDGLLTEVTDSHLVRVLAWYDNETGFSARLLDLVQWMAHATTH